MAGTTLALGVQGRALDGRAASGLVRMVALAVGTVVLVGTVRLLVFVLPVVKAEWLGVMERTWSADAPGEQRLGGCVLL